MWCVALIGILLSVGAGSFFLLNPILFGFETGVPHNRFFVYESHFMLDGELAYVRRQLGGDYDAYRNHCLRMMTYVRYQLPDSVYDVHLNAMNIVGMTLAFHAIGLWADDGLYYLESSVRMMEEILRKEEVWDKPSIDIARQAILNQHNMFKFEAFDDLVTNQIVEAIRKASWADTTMGIIRHDLPAPLLEAAYAKLPSKNFHETIIRRRMVSSTMNMLGRFGLLKVFKP